MMLEAVNINKFYGPRPVLTGVSFDIDRGEVVGFLGVNGAGKSTTMRILSGFLAPTLGRALVDGQDPRLPKTREKIGYLPESNPLPSRMRVSEYLRFRAGLKGIPRRKTKALVQETAVRCRVDEFIDRMIGHLSKGMRQRVGLADSLLASPELLILDEPTAGLDPHQAQETRELIHELGKGCTVFLSSHILSDIERLCPRVLILDGGQIVADGDPEAICERNVEERTVHLQLIAAEPVRESFRAIPGVKTVTIDPDQELQNTISVRLTIPTGVDLRQELSHLCAQRGWLITEMRLEPVRLEDIFRKLTANR